MEKVCVLNSKSSSEPHLLGASPSSHAAQVYLVVSKYYSIHNDMI